MKALISEIFCFDSRRKNLGLGSHKTKSTSLLSWCGAVGGLCVYSQDEVVNASSAIKSTKEVLIVSCLLILLVLCFLLTG